MLYTEKIAWPSDPARPALLCRIVVLSLSDTFFPDVKLIELNVFHDARGYFLESFQARRYGRLPGQAGPFVQDNFSQSRRGVLRGLHFQHPHGQGKLVRVARGQVYDVVADVRAGSPTFGKWQGFTLSDARPRQLWIPPGYAHGFMALSDEALVEYKCTDYYHPEHEACLRWDDPQLSIDWPLPDPIVSDKDRQGLTLQALQEAGRCPAF